MPQFTNHVKRIREQLEIILTLTAILRRFAVDLTDTLRDAVTRFLVSSISKTVYV